MNLTAWIRTADEITQAGGVIEVALGNTPVATIAATDAPLYDRVLGDAAAREEHPCLEATLSLHEGEYLLEIATPPDFA